jgi:hypothetical protein
MTLWWSTPACLDFQRSRHLAPRHLHPTSRDQAIVKRSQNRCKWKSDLCISFLSYRFYFVLHKLSVICLNTEDPLYTSSPSIFLNVAIVSAQTVTIIFVAQTFFQPAPHFKVPISSFYPRILHTYHYPSTS